MYDEVMKCRVSYYELAFTVVLLNIQCNTIVCLLSNVCNAGKQKMNKWEVSLLATNVQCVLFVIIGFIRICI